MRMYCNKYFMAELILTFQFDLHKLYKHKKCITTVKIKSKIKSILLKLREA